MTNLFNNPLIDSAKKALSPQEIQHFKNIVVTFQNLQIIKTILTFRLSEYCKSGSTVS